jgi:hypothetical protein
MRIINEIPSKISPLSVMADISLVLLIQVTNIVETEMKPLHYLKTSNHKSGRIHPGL